MEKALKITRKQLAVIAAVVALILVIATCQWRAAEDRRREEEIVTAQGLVQVIDATFSEQNALKVGQVSGRLDVTTVDPGLFSLLSSSQKVVLPYLVDYTVDLSQWSREDFRWDPETRTLEVRVPDIETGRPNIDEARRKLLQTRGLWVSREASENLSRRAAVLAEQAATREAANPAHQAKARENARRSIARLLEAPLGVAGFSDVTVMVRFPGEPGARDPSYLDRSLTYNEAMEAARERRAGEKTQ